MEWLRLRPDEGISQHERCFFEHHLDASVDPNEEDTFDCEHLDDAAKAKTPAAELAAMKAASGGIRLAYKLMSSSLQCHIKILYVATQQLWTWYADQVATVKTPTDGFNYCVRMAEHWAQEPHLWNTLAHSLYTSDSLLLMGLGLGPVSEATNRIGNKVLMLVWHIVSHRGWSMTRHSVPPECFAHVASARVATAERGMESMRTSWKALVMLEQRMWGMPIAKQLWQDLDFAGSRPIRLMFCFLNGINGDGRLWQGEEFCQPYCAYFLTTRSLRTFIPLSGKRPRQTRT